jgi:hypothetical protein
MENSSLTEKMQRLSGPIEDKHMQSEQKINETSSPAVSLPT